eukprot:CAMPEP_0198215524 /NCGR_PEP_ID=MMETSP1445-20131203/50537_1 /TAXON_ID=36898 /ORGANISM="Pyramimonas sp., Strain CCMP2087" /LENGTH=278 /DNA_ID=CAMNT_0043891291 /DNA_START=158 /DNA_END=991 /DNA_ORIENTATION=+
MERFNVCIAAGLPNFHKAQDIEYTHEIERSRANRDNYQRDQDVILGRKDPMKSRRTGHVSRNRQQFLQEEALAMYNISEDRVKRLEELAEQVRNRTEAERPTSKELFMHVRNNTLEKVKTLTRKVSTKLASGLVGLVGSPFNCSTATTLEIPIEKKDGSGGGDSTNLAANPRGLIANVTFPNGVTLPLGAHSSDSDSGGTLCDSSDIPELPEIIKWLVGVDNASTNPNMVRPPKMARTLRNVGLAFTVALAIVCLGFCAGARVHRHTIGPNNGTQMPS